MLFSILTILVCILLILVILIQNSKGGGIQSQFGAATQIMGVKRGTEFVEKATWGLAITLIALSVLMSPQGTTTSVSEDDAGSAAKRRSQTAVPLPAQQQQAPQQMPVQEGPASQPANQEQAK